MSAWLGKHPRLRDAAIIGSALAVSISLTDELGAATALVIGMAVLLIANILLPPRSSSR